MCRAYTISKSANELASIFDLDLTGNFDPTYNAIPAKRLPVITQNSPEKLSFFYWGTTPGWAKNKMPSEKLYNARIEKAGNLAAYKNALINSRCAVIADGFYVWRQISKKGQVPYYYKLANEEIFAFAGLWEEFESAAGNSHYTFTIITQPATTSPDTPGGRLPCILTRKQLSQWLEGSLQDPLSMLQLISQPALTSSAVSNRINDPANDDPGLVLPTTPADQFGNYSLFD